MLGKGLPSWHLICTLSIEPETCRAMVWLTPVLSTLAVSRSIPDWRFATVSNPFWSTLAWEEPEMIHSMPSEEAPSFSARANCVDLFLGTCTMPGRWVPAGFTILMLVTGGRPKCIVIKATLFI